MNIESAKAGFTEEMETCSEWYQDVHAGSMTVWIEEDGGRGCICFAFRNEFTEGRKYPMACEKRQAIRCSETGQIGWNT
jgi:hypothetical protein